MQCNSKNNSRRIFGGKSIKWFSSVFGEYLKAILKNKPKQLKQYHRIKSLSQEGRVESQETDLCIYENLLYDREIKSEKKRWSI